ncbi:Dynactin subunit 6 [Armadillidium nasatum]|uniref:Dynactin subunit 6 n=1 Tax=Armadillidium nasatum TaxID=96803 RepID=A0A5N5TFX8_9CRUS|nr:Dynactin subunit 6 [Armadillidium nasatum]
MNSPRSSDPPANVQVKPGAVVCCEAEYVGDITIGSRTVVHPKAKIIAEAGPIIMGEGNLIEEQALIINRIPEGCPGNEERILYIGNNNVFEVDSHCEARKIGDSNVLEAKSYVGPNVELTKGCVVGALCSLRCQEVIPENTVIYGDHHNRRTQIERPPVYS